MTNQQKKISSDRENRRFSLILAALHGICSNGPFSKMDSVELIGEISVKLADATLKAMEGSESRQ